MTRRFPGLAGSVVAIAILGLAIGAVTSLAAMLFVDMVALLNDRLFISPASRQETGSFTLLVLVTVLVPTIGGLVVGTLNQFIPEKRAHAPADIVRAVQGFEGHIPTRSGLLSTASSVISLGAGASTGQYGPLAHLGATLGSAIADIDERRRWMGNVRHRLRGRFRHRHRLQCAARRDRLRARGDPEALLAARLRSDHRRRRDWLRDRQRGLRAPAALRD